MLRSTPIPVEVANKIYDILCEHAGQRRIEPIEDDNRRAEFLGYATRGTWTEFRFMGALGGGGKIWNQGSRWFVNAYVDEEKRPSVKRMIAKTNAALDKLFEEITGVKPQG